LQQKIKTGSPLAVAPGCAEQGRSRDRQTCLLAGRERFADDRRKNRSLTLVARTGVLIDALTRA